MTKPAKKHVNRILLVEDDSLQAEFLESFINRWGYICQVAEDGAKARKLIEEWEPDLILLDIFLPDTSGIVLLQELRDNPKTEQTPTILMSADTSEETSIIALSSGANDFLSKPLKIAELSSRIQKELDLIHYKKSLIELNEKLKIEKKRLLKFFSEDVVEALLTDDGYSELGGSLLTASILFVDIRNSTLLAERNDPKDFAGFISMVFSDLMDLIFSFKGSVNKLLGDGILATFGCPRASKDDALNSVRCAMKIREWVESFNMVKPDFITSHVQLGIGICTGTVFAGNVGSFRRMEYTVMGDPVNTASRLQSLTKEVSTDILIDGETVKTIGESVVVEQVPINFVRGRHGTVQIYKVLELKEELSHNSIFGDGT